MWLPWWVGDSCLHISSIISTSCDQLGSGTRECPFILRMRLRIRPNTQRLFWSMWGMIPGRSIDVCQSFILQAYRRTFSSPLQRLQHLFNLPFIHMIGPSMRKNTWHLQCSRKDTWANRSCSTLADCGWALFEFTAWVTKKQVEDQSKSQWLRLQPNRD